MGVTPWGQFKSGSKREEVVSIVFPLCVCSLWDSVLVFPGVYYIISASGIV